MTCTNLSELFFIANTVITNIMAMPLRGLAHVLLLIKRQEGKASLEILGLRCFWKDRRQKAGE